MVPMKEKVSDILAGLNQMRDAHVNLERTLSSGPASFYFEKLGVYIDGLFSFSKFKDGDPVQLAHDINCNSAPGWAGSEHFLKRGATAKVEEVDYGKRGFSYGIVFDNETWLDQKGVARPVSDKHQFWMLEKDLEPAPAKKTKRAA